MLILYHKKRGSFCPFVFLKKLLNDFKRRSHRSAGALFDMVGIEIPKISHSSQLFTGKGRAQPAVEQTFFSNVPVHTASLCVITVLGTARASAVSHRAVAGTEGTGHAAVAIGIGTHASHLISPLSGFGKTFWLSSNRSGWGALYRILRTIERGQRYYSLCS